MSSHGWTLALQAGNFLVLVWLLRRFLFRPVLAAIDRRQAETDRILADAEAARTQARAEADSLRTAREGLAVERDTMLGAARAEAERARADLLDAARREAAAVRAKAEADLAAERVAVLGELKDKAAALAVEAAAAILRSAAIQPVAEAYLNDLVTRLGGNGPATVVTAPALDDAARDKWRTRLRAVLGPDADIRFATDPGLVAGAEIHLPDRVLSLHWRAALARARKDMPA